MQDYFEHEITQAKKELTRLKTSSQKSSANARIIEQTVNISVNLAWEDISVPYGSARAEVFYETIPDGPAIVNSTLDWYYADINESYNTTYSTRQIKLRPCILPNGNQGVRIYFIGTENGPNSDAARAKNGETITMSVNLTVKSTNLITVRRYV